MSEVEAKRIVRQGRGGDGLYKKRGYWYFRPPSWNGKARAKSTGTKNHADARTYRGLFLKNLGVGSDSHTAERMLMRQATVDRLEAERNRVSLDTKNAHRSSMRNIDRLIGGLPLGKFSIDTIVRYQDSRLEEGAAPATINNETIMIKSILIKAKLWARLGEGYKRLKVSKEVGRNWTMEEIAAVKATAKNGQHPWYLLPVVELDFETGLRHKEIRWLRRRDFDFSRHTITVDRSTTKTDAGTRTVHMNSTAEFIARLLLAKAEELGSTRPEHCVFPAMTKNKPRHYVFDRPITSFNRGFTRLKVCAGVDSTLRIHDIRHHVTSDLAESAVSSAVACKELGWTSMEMRRVYEHLHETACDHAMDHLEKVRRKTNRVITPLPTASYEGSFQGGDGI